MANYLYYVGGGDQIPSQASITGTYEFSTFAIGGPGCTVSTNIVINAASSPYNGAFAGDGFAGGGFTRTYGNTDNWTQYFDPAGFQGAPQHFTIGCVDNDIQSDLNVGGQLNGFYDRNGTLQDLVSHHGSLGTNVYTVLSPGSVTKFGSQRDGTVLVWYLGLGVLGEGANAIGLPLKSTIQPNGGDTDEEAAAKILYGGLGVFKSNGTDHREFGWLPQG